MVVALVDDLLFSSKIRAAADRIGAEVAFVRQPESLIAEAREKKPHAVIVDLDRAALNPIDAIRALKADEDLRAVRVVGFVSHVHAELIQAARQAGADLVLARSAFVNKLSELLAGLPDSPESPTRT